MTTSTVFLELAMEQNLNLAFAHQNGFMDGLIQLPPCIIQINSLYILLRQLLARQNTLMKPRIPIGKIGFYLFSGAILHNSAKPRESLVKEEKGKFDDNYF